MLVDNMAKYKYKIVEFAPEQSALVTEKVFNELGKDGWDLVSISPVGLNVEGRSDSNWGTGGGETCGKFEKIAAFFKKVVG